MPSTTVLLNAVVQPLSISLGLNVMLQLALEYQCFSCSSYFGLKISQLANHTFKEVVCSGNAQVLEIDNYKKKHIGFWTRLTRVGWQDCGVGITKMVALRFFTWNLLVLAEADSRKALGLL